MSLPGQRRHGNATQSGSYRFQAESIPCQWKQTRGGTSVSEDQAVSVSQMFLKVLGKDAPLIRVEGPVHLKQTIHHFVGGLVVSGSPLVR